MFFGSCIYYTKKLLGVVFAESGYCGDDQPYPDYKKVCRGDTGYLEVVRVIFDTSKVSLQQVLNYFFEIHGIEQADGQGPDIGEQYKSPIFYNNYKQKQVAKDLKQILAQKGYKVATEIKLKKPYYAAEAYYLDYCMKKGTLPYFPTHKKIF